MPGYALVVVLWFAALWLAECRVPFYAEFPGGWRQRLRHDGANLGIGLVNVALTVVLLASAYAAVAAWADQRAFGLLRLAAWPRWVEVVLAIILFDLWMYVWHRANHEIPLLWRFHRMHHSDPDMDATTALRFHPGEVLLSGVARLAVIPLLGMHLWQLAIYESVLLTVVLLHHSNVSLPRRLDHGLLVLVVTPAMHRVHHSRARSEMDSNYGSVFPCWDRLLGSYRRRANARELSLGLDRLDGARWQGVVGMLRTPFAPPG